MVRNVANDLSYLRMFAVLLGWLSLPFGSSALGPILVFCGLTDIFDGYIARSFGFESRRGAKVDSLADLLVLFSAVLWLVVVFELVSQYPLLVFLGVGAQILAYVAAIYKLGRLAALHLTSAKIMAFVGYFFVFYTFFFELTFYTTLAACAALVYNGIEETLVILRREID